MFDFLELQRYSAFVLMALYISVVEIINDCAALVSSALANTVQLYSYTWVSSRGQVKFNLYFQEVAKKTNLKFLHIHRPYTWAEKNKFYFSDLFKN